MQPASFLKTTLLIVFLLFASGCEQSVESPVGTPSANGGTTIIEQEDQRLAAFFEELFERDVSESPEFQARLGRKTEDYGQWNDYSEAFSEY